MYVVRPTPDSRSAWQTCGPAAAGADQSRITSCGSSATASFSASSAESAKCSATSGRSSRPASCPRNGPGPHSPSTRSARVGVTGAAAGGAAAGAASGRVAPVRGSATAARPRMRAQVGHAAATPSQNASRSAAANPFCAAAAAVSGERSGSSRPVPAASAMAPATRSSAVSLPVRVAVSRSSAGSQSAAAAAWRTTSGMPHSSSRYSPSSRWSVA